VTNLDGALLTPAFEVTTVVADPPAPTGLPNEVKLQPVQESLSIDMFFEDELLIVIETVAAFAVAAPKSVRSPIAESDFTDFFVKMPSLV
jgi:hypothetical protein